MPNEGMPKTNGDGQKMERGPSMAARARAAEFRDERNEAVSRLVERYKAVQAQIAKLHEDMQRGIRHTSEQKDPRLDELGIELRAKTLDEIDTLEGEKGRLEREIREKGGEPSTYTVQ